MPYLFQALTRLALGFCLAVPVIAAIVMATSPDEPVDKSQSTFLQIRPLIADLSASRGQTVVQEFEVTNRSPESVTVLGATSSCSCTALLDDAPFALAPGESRIVRLGLTVTGQNEDGFFEQSSRLIVDRKGFVPALSANVRVLPVL